jgi:hypothetical protein
MILIQEINNLETKLYKICKNKNIKNKFYYYRYSQIYDARFRKRLNIDENNKINKLQFMEIDRIYIGISPNLVTSNYNTFILIQFNIRGVFDSFLDNILTKSSFKYIKSNFKIFSESFLIFHTIEFMHDNLNIFVNILFHISQNGIGLISSDKLGNFHGFIIKG